MLPTVPFDRFVYKDMRALEFSRNIIPKYDIICLQEVFHNWFLDARKNLFEDISKRNGFSYSARSPAPKYYKGHLTDAGLLIISRFPILQSEFLPFSDGIMSDQIADKGILYTQIQIKDKILHLFNTHTQATYFSHETS